MNWYGTYSSGIVYSPLGGMTNETFGTDTALYNKTIYNSRGQAAEIRVGTYHPTDSTWWNRGAIINHYSDSCWGSCGGSNSTTQMTDNNGNLKKQEVYIPNNDVPNTQQITSYTTWWQQYNYDALNRLDWVREISNGAEIWKQDFAYDRYGNRTIDQTNTWGPAAGPAINKKNFTVDTSTNRLGVPAGQSGTMSYDNAGNLTTDTYSGSGVTRAYDAENRMTSETQANSYVSGSYSYNADGQRVRRTVGGQPSAVTTWQVYGMEGELLAEYAASAAPAMPQKEYGYRNGQLLITAEAAPPVNLALNKPASQSSTYIYGDPTPNLAVDGNTDGVWLDHSVASTNNEAQAWWRVDLGSTTAVSSVEVWNRTDCCPERLSNFNVMLLDANQATVTSVNVTGPGGTPTTVAISGTARYVKVQLVGTNFLSLAEVKVWSTAAGAANINWLVTDQLGTPGMVFDKTGSLAATKRHDYLPFGEDIFAGTGSRTTTQGYQTSPNPNDGVRQKFTSKERDIETGLDYFGARYYGSPQGRFTTPDPLLGSGNPSRPQTWNRYAYVVNNPLRMIDPDGLDGEDTEEQRKKAAQPHRTIYVFVGGKDRGTPWQPNKNSAKAGYKPTTVPGDNFADLAKNAPKGTEVKVISEGDSQFSPQGFTDALQDKNAAGVVFVGDTTGERDPNGVYHATGLDFGGNGTLSADSTVQVNAQNVAVFGCDSKSLGSMFSFSGSNQSFIGMNSGSDGYSSPGWLGRAAFATASTFERGGNPDQAVRAANNRFHNFGASAPFGPKNVSRGINVHNAEPKDIGDTVLKLR